MGPSKVDVPHIREQPAQRYVPWRTRYLEAADTPRGIARPVLPEFSGATFALAAESASPAGWVTIEKRQHESSRTPGCGQKQVPDSFERRP
jgi:hypothetical protein